MDLAAGAAADGAALAAAVLLKNPWQQYSRTATAGLAVWPAAAVSMAVPVSAGPVAETAPGPSPGGGECIVAGQWQYRLLEFRPV